jgi:hypothetical protein
MLLPMSFPKWRQVRLAAFFAALACDSSTAPKVSIIQPVLGRFVLEESVNGPEGFLSIQAESVDPKHEFQPNERAALEVVSSGGDKETLFLRPGICRDPVYLLLYCDRIMIGMRDGYHADSLRPRLRSIDGRYTVVSISGTVAGITLFSDHVDGVIRTVASWPGVRSVEKIGPFLLTDAGADFGVFSWLQAQAPFDPGTPIPGNGRLEVQHGDVLTATYRQADGSTSTTTFTVDLVSPVRWPYGYPANISK